MIDAEVLYYIRDEMLTDPSEDAQFIYLCSHLAERDRAMYDLLVEWMADVQNRPVIETEIHARAEWLTEYDDLFS